MFISLYDETNMLPDTYEIYDLVDLIPSIILSENHPLYKEGCTVTTSDLGN